jgi:flagellar biosynthesis protein FliR
MIADVNLETVVLALFLAFCRIGACFMMMPGLASVRVPVQVRLFVAVAASVALLAHLWETIIPLVERSTDRLALLIVSEILIGALIGLVARFYLLALQFMGSAVAMMSGFNAMAGVSVEEPEQQSPLAAIISLSALLLLFILDFHHEIVRALIGSYQVIPIEGLFNAQAALVNLADTLSEAFFMMLRLGSPFIAYAILVSLATGLINKLTPQIPIYFVSLPFLIAGALIMMYFAIGPLLTLFADGFVPMTVGR